MSYVMKSSRRGGGVSAPMLKLPIGRSHILVGLVLVWFLALLGRAFYLQGMDNHFLRQKGDERSRRVIELTAHRGMITDRNGEPLAISTPVESVWVSPKDFEITPERIRQLGKILEMSGDDVKSRFTRSQRDFVYLKRQVPPETAERVMQVNAPGVFLRREYRRYYPAGEVVAHILGFTGVDDNGQEGLELTYQNWLAGKPGSRHVIKDRLGHIIEDVESVQPPQDGRDLALSIDRKIQYLAYREIKAAVVAQKAKAGAIVVLDAKTGEILALANLPAYNPNNRLKLNRNSTRNRAVTDTFEPGSTMKPFTAAAVLESGKLTPNSLIQTAPGSFTIGSATIHDSHPEGVLTVSQVIQKSSNVGAAKMALSLEPEYLWNVFDRMGFGKAPHAGFPGEATGRLRPYKTWQPIEQATMAYGHGISVSLLQLARSYMAFTGDGEIRPVSLVKLDVPPAGVKVIAAETSQAVRSMLELVVLPGGTAPRAQVMGYRVAGKTGTAHKEENGHYAENRYIASFVGLAPASNPRLIVAVMIDEPSNGQYYGGAVAAPVFSQVMAGALRLLSVPPDAPTNNILPPESTPEVKEVV